MNIKRFRSKQERRCHLNRSVMEALESRLLLTTTWYWQGGGGPNANTQANFYYDGNWTDRNGHDGRPDTGDIAVFDPLGNYANAVTMWESREVAEIRVIGATITLDLFHHTLTAGTISIKNDQTSLGKLIVKTNNSSGTNNILNVELLCVADGISDQAELEVDAAVLINAGSLTAGGAVSDATLRIDGGSVAVTNGSQLGTSDENEEGPGAVHIFITNGGYLDGGEWLPVTPSRQTHTAASHTTRVTNTMRPSV